MDDAQLAVCWERLAQAQAPAGPSPVAGEVELIGALRAFGFRQRSLANGTFYELDYGDVRAQGRGPPLERAGEARGGCVLAGAGPAVARRLFEVLPLPRPVEGLSADKIHLLPLPAEARQVCSRWTQGECLRESACRWQCLRSRLLDQWAAAGWQVQRTRPGGDDGFDYICFQGRRSIRAVSATTGKRRAGSSARSVTVSRVKST